MREQAPWVEAFRGRVDGDPTSAYLWLSLACGPAGFAVPERNLRASVVATTSAVPLVSFKLAAGCTPRNRAALEALLEREPRFVEIHYVLGIIALAGEGQPNQGLLLPNLEVADAHYQAAYDWRPDWPALTQAIANLAMTAEDFGRAHEFYERTLALVPDNADAMVGGIRALTYGGRYDEAIAAANRMLTTDRSPGRGVVLARLQRVAAQPRQRRLDRHRAGGRHPDQRRCAQARGNRGGQAPRLRGGARAPRAVARPAIDRLRDAVLFPGGRVRAA